MFKFSFLAASNSFAARVVTALSGAALIAGTGLLAGCPSHSSEQSSAPPPVAQAAVFHGSVFGGRQPIKGAAITVYAVAPNAATATFAATIGTATTGANGQFSIAGFSPVPADGAIIYVTATGGNSQGGDPGVSSNAAIYLMTIAGAYCSGANCDFPGFVNVNELTTVAAVFSAGNFLSVAGITGPGAGQAQAAKTFLNLVDPASGTARVPGTDEGASCTGSGEPVNCEALRRMDTLANIAASCVNSESASAFACQNLFAVAWPSGATEPTTVAGALENIVRIGEIRNEGEPIFALVSSAAALYSPTLASAPRAWTLALRFTGGGLNPSPDVAAAQAQARLAAYSGPEASDFAPSGSGADLRLGPQSAVGLLQKRAMLAGAHAPGSQIKLTFALKLRNVAALKRFLHDVVNSSSSAYRHYLTPQQFTAMYGPSKADVTRVTDWLQAQGIRVLDVSPNRTLIHTEAATGACEQALGIAINDYRMNGREFYSTTDNPTLPRAVAGRLNAVLGLNHGVQLHPVGLFQQPVADARGLGPRTAPAPSLIDMNPLQIAAAYDVPDITNAANAASVAIAIVTAESQGVSTSADFSTFWAGYGLPDHTINEFDIDGSPITGGERETWLDIEYSGSMAPGATLNVYISSDAFIPNFTDAYNQVVTDNSSAVMTTSWGAPDSIYSAGTIAADEAIFLQAAAQGISVFAAAGDHGAADGGYGLNNADYPSSSVFVTAANGTQLTISDLAGDYGSEVVWHDPNCFGHGLWSSGGGISAVIAKPFWQVGPGVPGSVTMRMNSDLAMTASCSRPMLILYFGSYQVAAGTSAVAPMLAGIFATGVSHQPGHTRLGQINEQLYNDAAAHYATDFHDITSGCNGELPDGSPSCAGPNWDHPSGWGSPKVSNLLQHIGVQGPAALAVDKSGNIWVVNYQANTLSEFNAQGTPLSPSTGFGAGDLDGPDAVAADGVGHIWVANYKGNNLTEFSASDGSVLATVPLSAPTALVGDDGSIAAASENNDPIAVDAFANPPTILRLAIIHVDDAVDVGFMRDGVAILNHGDGSFCFGNNHDSRCITGLGIGPSAFAFPFHAEVGGYYAPLWIANDDGNSITVSIGPGSIGTATGGGLDGPIAVAQDIRSHAWFANGFGHSISEFTAATPGGTAPAVITAISPPAPASSLQGGYAGAGLSWPRGIVIDSAGNIWTTSNAPNNRGLVEFIGLAAPPEPGP